MKPTPRLLLLLLLLALAAASCTLDLPEPEKARPLILCETNDGCEGSLRCEAGFCVVNTRLTEVIGVEITPLESDGLAPEQLPAVTLQQGSPLPDLQLAPSQQLQGTVRLDGDTPRNLTARLILTRRQPDLPGRNLRFDATATTSGGWFVRLPPGWYDINVLPDEASLPPLTVLGLPVQSDTQHNVLFAPPEEYITVRGQLIYRDANTERDTIVAGARIEAIDTDQRTVSTVGTTAEDGSFSIVIRPDVSTYALVVSPSTLLTPALPRIVIQDLDLVGANIELGVISLGVLQPRGRWIEGRTLDIYGKRIANVRLLLQTDLSDPDLPQTATRFTTDVLSDDEGRFALILQPGVYSIQAIPPIDSGSALSAFASVEVSPPGTVVDLNAWNLRLRPKTQVRGAVLTPNRAPLPGLTRITFQNLGLFGFDSTDDATPTTIQRNTTAIANADGTFEVAVDPGEYLIQATPPIDSGWASTPPLRVQIRSTGTQDLTLCALPPSVAYGTVLDPDGRALANAKVELFRLNSPRGVWSLGSGRTAEDGSYRILIPRICDGDPTCEAECTTLP